MEARVVRMSKAYPVVCIALWVGSGAVFIPLSSLPAGARDLSDR